MNEALLSSKNMNWCTPQDFFDKLNEEFSFTLDAAATDKSAKCEKYYTPETDGLKSPWNCGGGVLYFAIRLTATVLVFGWKKHTTKRRTVQRSSFLSRRERIRRIFTTTYTEKRKSVSYAVA